MKLNCEPVDACIYPTTAPALTGTVCEVEMQICGCLLVGVLNGNAHMSVSACSIF